ncbi:unnamed protein product [Onchocerca flexuosa]|uniref:Uncharacterized protein n=1 Tax=Onchocerca flexuosa TaxID=387005 RepID=A0A183HHU3_9BILA|nr:unnamed protein product [Onchocerca flexuosa]
MCRLGRFGELHASNELHAQWRFQSGMTVLPPNSNVTAILDDPRAKAASFWGRIAARINLIRNVLPISPGPSKKKIPSILLFTICII